MRNRWALASFAAMVAQLAPAAPPPPEAFAHLPPVQHPALSGSGRLLAWRDNGSKGVTVTIHDLAAAKVVRSFPVSATNALHGIAWSDEGTLLLTLTVSDRFTPVERWRTLSLDIGTGVNRLLLSDDSKRDAAIRPIVLATRTSVPHTVTMASWDYRDSAAPHGPRGRKPLRRGEAGWVHSAYQVDTGSGEVKLLEHGTQFTDEWVVDASGTPVARSEWYPAKRRYEVLARSGREWKRIHLDENAEELDLLGLAPDGRAVLASGARGGPWHKIWSLPLDGSGATVLVEAEGADVRKAIVDTLSGAVIGVHGDGPSPVVNWLDERAKKRQQALAASFPGRRVEIRGRSEDYQRVLVSVLGPSNPETYYVVDFRTGKANIVAEAYPRLAGTKLGEVRPFSYRARDGTEIPAYVILPPGKEEQTLPLVVLPHDGPEGRDDGIFDWVAQFLATRGYAVLQPQFRGSAGFGEAHRLAGHGQWGGTVLNDITDGVKALVDQKLADPNRICIAGAGFGGYAALAGAAFTPELYACAVSIDGFSDLPAFLEYIEQHAFRDSDVVVYWRRQMGELTDPRTAQWSPARAASTVRAPVLLVHAKDSWTRPFEQSAKMHRALKKHDRPVKLVTVPGTSTLLTSEGRVRVLEELEAFLGEHLD